MEAEYEVKTLEAMHMHPASKNNAHVDFFLPNFSIPMIAIGQDTISANPLSALFTYMSPEICERIML